TASRTPDSWKLKSVFISSISFGLWLTLSTIILFALTYQTNAFDGFIGAENLCVNCIKDHCQDFFTARVQECSLTLNSTACGELDGSIMKSSNVVAIGTSRKTDIDLYWAEYASKYRTSRADLFENLQGNHINNLQSTPEADAIYQQFVYQYTVGQDGQAFGSDKAYSVSLAAGQGKGVAFVGRDYVPLTNGVGFCSFVWDYSNFNSTWTRGKKLIGPGMQKKDGVLRGLIYTQVSISGQALIFVTRTAGINTWFFAEKPCNLLLFAFVIAQVAASVIGFYGFAGYPADRVAVFGCGGPYLAISWIWSVLWHFPLDLIKFAVNYILTKDSYTQTAFTSRINAGHPTMTHSKVTSVARSIRASRTVDPIVNWPPPVVVRALHQWGTDFDPLLQARPLWFKVCFVMEMTLQVPYYIVAIYGFIHRCEWLRVPTLVYAAQSVTVMVIVLTEQFVGEFKTSAPLVILASYVPFAIVPIFFLVRASGATMFGETKTKRA
ncbi:hypothetical protein DYB32_008493, partial [Aphanomyces invadans]